MFLHVNIDENCMKVYRENYGLKPEGNIQTIDIHSIPSFDILCAGFPCNAFSKFGFQKGFNDARGTLFFNICNITTIHKPKYMILENVRNIVSHNKGKTWKTIIDKIDEIGYNTYEIPLILNTLHFHVPQNRERVIILCKRKDLGDLPEKPTIQKINKHKLECSISDIIDTENDTSNYVINRKMKITEGIWNDFINILKTNGIHVPKFPIWTDWWDCKLDDSEEKRNMYEKYSRCIDKNRDFYNNNEENS